MASEAKRFTAETYEEAVKQATGYFDVPVDRLNINIIKAPEHTDKKKLFGFLHKKESYEIEASVNNEDISVLAEEPEIELVADSGITHAKALEPFYFDYYPDGVYLTLEKETTLNVILEAISTKNIINIDFNAVNGAIKNLHKMTLIAPPQEEKLVPETIEVLVNPDKMAVRIKFVHSFGGAAATEADILKRLDDYGVVYGIDMELVKQLGVEHNTSDLYVVAMGSKPIKGKDGVLVYDVKLSQRRDFSQADDLENIDFKNLMEYTKVSHGQLLAHTEPPTAGIPGTDVFGGSIPPIPGKVVGIPYGKNTTLSEDGTQLFSAINGVAANDKNKIVVDNQLTINSNIDISTGNIDYEGSVLIYGDILTGYSVTATENVDIKGHVEAAHIKAGHNISIVGGVIGGDKGVIEAGGSIMADYLQYANVIAGGDIICGALIGAIVQCEGNVSVLSGKGIIMGGEIVAQHSVAARVIGSRNGTQTLISVNPPAKRKQAISDATTRISNLNIAHKQLQEKIARLVEAKRTGRLAGSNVRYLAEAEAEEARVNTELRRLYEEINHLQSNDNLYLGVIHVKDIAYSASKLCISSAELTINSQYQHTTFKIENRQITALPYSL